MRFSKVILKLRRVVKGRQSVSILETGVSSFVRSFFSFLSFWYILFWNNFSVRKAMSDLLFYRFLAAGLFLFFFKRVSFFSTPKWPKALWRWDMHLHTRTHRLLLCCRRESFFVNLSFFVLFSSFSFDYFGKISTRIFASFLLICFLKRRRRRWRLSLMVDRVNIRTVAEF